MNTLNETHQPSLRSWLSSANEPDTDFPIQNLPYGRFRRLSVDESWRIGVAIGDCILDLQRLEAEQICPENIQQCLQPLAAGHLNHFMSLGFAQWHAMRQFISSILRVDSIHQAVVADCLVAQAQAEMTLPCEIGDYTDFFTSIHHASNIGKLFRPGENPLLPNYQWVPIGYHGRSSSIVANASDIQRPVGQILPTGASEPILSPSKRLDMELELGIFIGHGNALGTHIPIEKSEEHVFGICLLNDWSARDIQTWEYQPLGPFLSKSFSTSISPWIVTLEALAPYRLPFSRPKDDPQPLPYLDSEKNRSEGAFDIQLEVLIQTSLMRQEKQAPTRICKTNYQHAYWTIAQLVAHHTINGCNLRCGDLFGSGTLSGPTLDQAGALIELTWGGKAPLILPNGEQRVFLEDGDLILLKGWCEKSGATRIGFGKCQGIITAAISV